MKIRIYEVIIILLLLLALTLLFVQYYYIKTDKEKCITEPYTYSIKKLEQQFKKEIHCWCNEDIILNKSGAFQQYTIG